MTNPHPSPDLAGTLRQALTFHQQGQLSQAEALYQAALRQSPGHSDALHLLGVIALQRRDFEAAVRLIGEALQLNPNYAAALSNLGAALLELKRYDEAIASYDRALALEPDYVEALNNRGVALRALARHEAALASYDRALAFRPDYAEALNNRGNALRALDRPAEALASYERALALKPDYADALNSRGEALRDLDRPAEALASYDRTLAIRPDFGIALINRGNALFGLGRYDEALASYDRALALEPGNAGVLNNRGEALRHLDRHADALASYDHALAIAPDHGEALGNRGNALLGLGRYDEALASYERALVLRPGDAAALSNRGNALLGLKRHPEALAAFDQALAIAPGFADALVNRGNALHELRRHDEALASFDRALALQPAHAGALNSRGNSLRDLGRYEEAVSGFEHLLRVRPQSKYTRGEILHARNHCCDWSDYDADFERIRTDVVAGAPVITPFAFLSVSDSPSDQLACARTFARDKFPATAQPIWTGERYDHDRIRLAYLSADFYDHATAFLMAELFERHDKSRFETTAISFSPDSSSAMRARLEGAFDHFIDVRNQSDRDVARLLRQLEIDIAIDLKGFTGRSRPGILTHRPAPIQVNYLGFPATMGADHMDYIMADRVVIPEGQQRFYREKVAYLPDTYQANDSKRRIAEPAPTRAQAGLPETGFVFCSFNNNYKILPPVFEIWMRLLHQVEGSVLWLLGGNPAAIRNLRQNAERRGIAPERLVFAPRLKLDEHLARHRLAGILLDTLPCTAHTTASDALWAGLPVVTCLGGSFAGRVAASLLHAIGLPELITGTLDDYEALALDLARDPDRLAAIKARLARNRASCPLFDTDRIRRHLESAYETMWQRCQRGAPPAGFAVARTE